MQSNKLDQRFKPQIRKFEEITPKIPAKSPINYRQRKLAGQSSALPANRRKQKDTNIFKMQNPAHRLDSLPKEKSYITQQQIKNSHIYKLLEEQIANLAKRQQAQIQKMQQIKKNKQKQLTQLKAEQHAIKLQIWQLRNQTMQLQDSIKEEKEQTQKLMEQLDITEEDLESQNIDQQGQDYQNQDNNADNQYYRDTD